MTVQERKRIAARVLAAGGNDEQAARAAGRSSRTIRLWRESDEDFAALLEHARAARVGVRPSPAYQVSEHAIDVDALARSWSPVKHAPNP